MDFKEERGTPPRISPALGKRPKPKCLYGQTTCETLSGGICICGLPTAGFLGPPDFIKVLAEIKKTDRQKYNKIVSLIMSEGPQDIDF